MSPQKRTRLPTLAIVGRPNVGKSTLFNWLTRSRNALVLDEPGVTRDRQYGFAKLGRKRIQVIDTGGFVEDAKAQETMALAVNHQVDLALEEADALVVVLDAKSGILPGDEYFVRRLRKAEKPVVFAVNKVDRQQSEAALAPFYALGVEPLVAISAEHHLGMEALAAALDPAFIEAQAQWEREDEEIAQATINLAVVGRPNVGKSTLLNTLVGEERAMVSPVPGTTRDAVDAMLTDEKGIQYRLVDTAGIRRKSKTEGIDGLAVIKSLHAIEDAHLTILVVDLNEGVTEQDSRVAQIVHEKGRGVLIFGNKLDLLKQHSPDLTSDDISESVYRKLPQLSYAPLIMGSALKGVFPRRKFFSHLSRIEKARHLTIPTPELNAYLTQVLRQRSLPFRGGKRLKVYYLTQAIARSEKRGMRPTAPRFVCFVNTVSAVKAEDERFLINSLRKRYEFFGNPIQLEFRERKPIDKNP